MPPKNVPKLTRQQASDMQDMLIAEYEKEAFQKELHMIWYVAADDPMKRMKMRQELCLTIQGPIIKKFGFEVSRKGVAQSVMAFNDPELAVDPELIAKNAKMGVLVNPDMQGVTSDSNDPYQNYMPPKAAKEPPRPAQPPQPQPQWQVQQQQRSQAEQQQPVPLEEAFLMRFNLGPPGGFEHHRSEADDGPALGPHGPVSLTRESAVSMLNELIAGFVREQFQRKLREALQHAGSNPAKARAARQKVAMEVQIPIISQYGFEASFNGVLMSAKAFTEELNADPEIQQKNALVFWLIDPAAQAFTPVPKGPARVVLYTTFKVSGNDGELCSLTADLSGNVRSLKENIQLKTGILWQAQKLFVRNAEQDDWSMLHAIAHVGETVAVRVTERKPELVTWLTQVADSVDCLQQAPRSLLADWDFIWPAIQLQVRVLAFATPEIQGNRDVLLAVVKHAGQAIQFAPPHLRGDREVVLQAVRQDGWALQHASAELQGDREVVLNAVWQDGWSLQFAAPWLRGDREVVMTAAAKDAWVIGSIAPELQEDRHVVLTAVKQDWRVLETVCEKLRGDKEIIMLAVKQDGMALEFASKQLCADREVVFEAAKRSGEALRFADKDLCADKEIAYAAVRNCGAALAIIPPSTQDVDMAVTAIKQDIRALNFVDPRLQAEVRKRLGFGSAPSWRPPPQGLPGAGAGGVKRLVLPDLKRHFDVLGLNEGAAPQEIKKTYRKLALQHHPDKHNNSEKAKQLFQKINTAYQALKEALNL